jgi:hypothetical protein
MTLKRTVILGLTLFLLLPAPALPQKRTTSKSPKRPAAPAPRPSANLRAEAAQVAEKLKLLTRFLYIYGSIAAGLREADEQARRGEAPPALLTKIKQDKASVASTISNFRAGMETLEQSFHANPRLQRPYLKLLSATEALATAEQLAAANRFDEAGKLLISVAERLADLMVEMAS